MGDGVRPVAGAAVLDADQLATLLETNTSAFIRLNLDWVFTYVNAQAEILLQRPRERLVGRNLWTEFPNGMGSRFETEYRRAFATGKAVTFEESFEPVGGWFEVRATPDETGLSVFFLDVSARRRAYDRLALVAEITRILVGSRDVEAVAATLVKAVVPELATWAMVSLYDDEGRLHEATAVHRDEACAAEVTELQALHPRLISDLDIVATATASGEPQLRTGLAERIAGRAGDGDRLFQVLDRLGCDQALLLPLRARNRTLGVLSLFHGPGGEELAGELETAVGLADRAGLALENAQLYSRQRRSVETLQRSLLTPLPQPDHLHLVARYLPAAEGTEIGGDWYDAFLQPDGATVLVIGDIVGHDIAAAAAMGQLRNLLRGTAYDRGDGPANLLTRLDALITGLGVNTLATLLVGRLEQTTEQAARGEQTLRWSNAGHTPPMVRRSSGLVEVLEPEPDVLLGLDEAADRQDHTVTLWPGDTVLLYTDGLVERRDQSLTVGLAELARTLSRLEMTPLDDACDELLARLLVDRPFDDVAMLAVHIGAISVPPGRLTADPADW
jgi:serine phosphatase RsbU (regulator of sigma subunit)